MDKVETLEELNQRIDQAIYESEKEIAEGAKAIDADKAFEELEKKYFNQ